MDKIDIMFWVWEETVKYSPQNHDVFLYFCDPVDNKLMEKSLIRLSKVQNGIAHCPWRKN